MRSAYVFVLLAAASVILSVFSFASLVRERQRAADEAARQQCIDECERQRDLARGNVLFQEARANIQHSQALTACLVNNAGNAQATEECRAEENARFADVVAALDAQRRRIDAVFDDCATACGDDPTSGGEPPIRDYEPPFEIACIESRGFVCFAEVADICKHISGVCGNCWQSLCPDWTWEFSAPTPLSVTLVASAKPSEGARALATSGYSSTRVFLFVPPGVALQSGERLWLRFDYSDVPAEKAGKINVRRSKA